MNIKHIRQLHELLFCAVLGGMVSSVIYLLTGSAPGLVITMFFGWGLSNFLAALAEKRRIAEVQNLKDMYEKPASNEK